MRATYAKAKARVKRWDEEVIWVLEEMRRSVEFLHDKGFRWQQRAYARPGCDPQLQSGLEAYAFRQAHVYQSLADQFQNRWQKCATGLGLTIDWTITYGPPMMPLPSTAEGQPPQSHTVSLGPERAADEGASFIDLFDPLLTCRNAPLRSADHVAPILPLNRILGDSTLDGYERGSDISGDETSEDSDVNSEDDVGDYGPQTRALSDDDG